MSRQTLPWLAHEMAFAILCKKQGSFCDISVPYSDDAPRNSTASLGRGKLLSKRLVQNQNLWGTPQASVGETGLMLINVYKVIGEP